MAQHVDRSAPTGQTATLAEGTLGYEYDTDEDNGFRPAGLIRLSETTETVERGAARPRQDLLSGPLTHYLTMYRATSGALVFGAGTVQWAWGLDEYHDTPHVEIPADVRMQQATLNLLADMGDPHPDRCGLVAASASTDTTPPVATISSPGGGAGRPLVSR